MIEDIIIEYLSQAQDLPVYAELPVDPPDECIVIQRTGGTESNLIREATVALQTNARASRYRAAHLAEAVRPLMLEMISLPGVFHCSVEAGPYDFTDPDTGCFRYQTVYTINYM